MLADGSFLFIHGMWLLGVDVRTWGRASDSLVGDIDSFEYAPESDADYRHRLWINFLAAVVLAVLVIAELWLLNALVETKQTRYSALAIYAPALIT